MLHRDIYLDASLLTLLYLWAAIRKHLPFFERSVNLWAHWLCTSTTASYTLVYLWIFIDYYGECEMADTSTYLKRPNGEYTLIYGLLVTLWKRGAESAAFKETWTRSVSWKQSWFLQGKGVFTLPLRNTCVYIFIISNEHSTFYVFYMKKIFLHF